MGTESDSLACQEVVKSWALSQLDIDSCRKDKIVLFCPSCSDTESGHLVKAVRPFHCRQRLCPSCARARHMELYHRYRGIYFKWPAHLVLTLKNSACPGRDVARIIEGFQRFRKLYLSRVKKRMRSQMLEDAYSRMELLLKEGKLKGKWVNKRGTLNKRLIRKGVEAKLKKLPKLERGIWGVECEKDRWALWHVHIHILTEIKWLEKDIAEGLWRDLTGDSWVLDVRRVGQKNSKGRFKQADIDEIVLEVTKYVAKGLSTIHRWKRKRIGKLTTGWEYIPFEEFDKETLYYAILGHRLMGHWGMTLEELSSRVHKKDLSVSSTCCKYCGEKLQFYERQYHFEKCGSRDPPEGQEGGLNEFTDDEILPC